MDETKQFEIFKSMFQTPVDYDRIRDICAELISKELSSATRPVVIQVGDKPAVDVGLTHHMFTTVVKVLSAGLNLMLVGPAGSGKTHTCSQAAKALDLEFLPLSVGPQTTQTTLLGFVDAAGNYHSTPLRKAFESGGLLLLDEVDAANPSVLTVVNSMLSNGHCSFPDKVVSKHESFRCVCAANTYGRGADRLYVGRNQLDAATLDRFAVVDFDYDLKLEEGLCPNQEWLRRVRHYRAKAEANRMRVVVSPRASIFGCTLLASGFSMDEVEEMLIFKGLDKDARNKLSSGIGKPGAKLPKPPREVEVTTVEPQPEEADGEEYW